MIKVYVSEHCGPCKEIRERVAKLGNDVQIVDIETDEGFADFTAAVLAKGDGAVPSAYKEGQKCKIMVEEGTQDIQIVCPGDEPEISQ
ncbi:MAG: hypothetical protein PHI12_08480 [Dehalococcoidales bacterium]|nr:hypothetical protein [Dehalococcoidales bacterium]